MATSHDDSPTPSWLVQEPEGHGAPRTPGRWKIMWASDCARLEEAHRKGDAEVLVYGRKYLVDMKERTVRPLYWEEEPASKPVIRATYFVHQGHGWLPYGEKDSELLETAYADARVQLRSTSCPEVEVPLTDGESKVVLTRSNAGMPAGDCFSEFDIAFHQQPLKEPLKAPSRLGAAFHANEVHRGSPEPGGWGGVPATRGDLPHEGEPPKHLVFVVHGMGESLLSKSTIAMRAVAASVRDSTGPMRAMSASLLEEEQRNRKAASEAETASGRATATGAHSDVNPLAGLGWGSGWGSTGGRWGRGGDTAGVEGEQIGEGGGDGSAGYVEFLPVEWFEEVHGKDAVSEQLMESITLPTLHSFRQFSSQGIADVMAYLTPKTQAAILAVVGNKMNAMWKDFSRLTPGFTGKVSVVGHSLGSIITHDILMAQPAKGQTGLAEGAVCQDIPILSFYPDVLLVCGSPIGMFLALRQTSGKDLFKFNTTNRFFNLFHLYDPVAYRLEPLLDMRLRELEPKQVPHKGGDRMHVSVKKFNKEVNAVIGRLTSQKGHGWDSIRSFNTRIKSAIADPGSIGAGDSTSVSGDEVSDAKDGLAERIDWVIQESTLEGMQPWASAVFAHNSYFSNIDLIMFLVNRLNEDRQEEEETGGGR